MTLNGHRTDRAWVAFANAEVEFFSLASNLLRQPFVRFRRVVGLAYNLMCDRIAAVDFECSGLNINPFRHVDVNMLFTVSKYVCLHNKTYCVSRGI